MEDKKVDTSKSNLVLEGTKKEIDSLAKKIQKDIAGASVDKSDRKKIYDKRRDFFYGNQEKYTNIVGLSKKGKRGHADQVLNYAGVSIRKVYHNLVNKPPHIKTLPIDQTDVQETINTQSVENFVGRVFWYNKFWKRGFKRAGMNQSLLGDFALKVYYDPKEKEIRITNAEKMENLLVGWRSDDALDYDWVAHTELVSVESIKAMWKIEVEADFTPKGTDSMGQQGDEWNTDGNKSDTEEHKETMTQPMALVTEYCTDKIYAIMIGNTVVQRVVHEYGFNPWVIGHSLHVPGKPWSRSFIDDLMSPQIELNEVMNDERDYIRTAANAKYVAKNMSDFDPESIKPGSGQVIFTEENSDFTALTQQVNTFPADTYAQRIKTHIHDLLVPQVGFGSGGGDSGRAKAIDFQTIVDVVDDLRDNWELVLDGVSERIQKLGNKYFPAEFWNNSNGEFEVRMVEFDWADVTPITQSDKIVDVLNKFQMGLPYKVVFEELGYKDPEAMVEMMRQEAEDQSLVLYRAKMYSMMKGAQEATMEVQQNQMAAQGMTPPGNQPSPVLTNGQNEGRESSLPMAQSGGNTSFSSPAGLIEQTKQNLGAQGK